MLKTKLVRTCRAYSTCLVIVVVIYDDCYLTCSIYLLCLSSLRTLCSAFSCSRRSICFVTLGVSVDCCTLLCNPYLWHTCLIWVKHRWVTYFVIHVSLAKIRVYFLSAVIALAYNRFYLYTEDADEFQLTLLY